MRYTTGAVIVKSWTHYYQYNAKLPARLGGGQYLDPGQVVVTWFPALPQIPYPACASSRYLKTARDFRLEDQNNNCKWLQEVSEPRGGKRQGRRSFAHGRTGDLCGYKPDIRSARQL